MRGSHALGGRSIRRVLDSATHSMTMVLNVFLLLFLVFVCYGLVGLTMFGNRFNYQYSDGTECLWNFHRSDCQSSTDFDPRNFDNFYRAMHTLFIVMTMDGESREMMQLQLTDLCTGWEDVMYTAMSTSTANKYMAPVFFISFVILTGFLIVNLLVAAILDNLQVDGVL